MLRVEKKHISQIYKVYQERLKALRLRRLMTILQRRERAGAFTSERVKLYWKLMNCSALAPKGMLCDLCEQTVPEKAKGRYKCVRCKARYCSKDHLKTALKFHHRNCSGGKETAASFPPPATESQTSLPLNCGEEAVGLWNESTNLNQNLNIAKYVVDNLTKHGHCVLDHFHGENIAKAILNEVKALHAKGSFKDGQLQSTTGHGTANRKIREDEITWMNGTEDGGTAISHHMSITDALLQLCNHFIKEKDIENRTPAMVACYPGKGAGYKRHIDNPNKDGRLITTIYYLNQGWNAQVDGGVLKIFPEQNCFESNKSEVDIEPVFDRLLMFWSDKRNPHEVCPAYRQRYAITLWYFDSAERKSFFEQLKQKQKSKPEISDSKDLKSEDVPKSTKEND